MIDQGMLQGKWHQIRGKLREKWGQLTDDDLARFDGNVEQLVGQIQRRTGESRHTVERFLDQVAGEGANFSHQAQAFAIEAVEQVRQAGQNVRDSFESGYAKAEGMVQERPAQSMLAAFGCGVIAGACVVVLLLRERPSDGLWSRSRDAADHWARKAFEAIANRTHA